MGILLASSGSVAACFANLEKVEEDACLHLHQNSIFDKNRSSLVMICDELAARRRPLDAILLLTCPLNLTRVLYCRNRDALSIPCGSLTKVSPLKAFFSVSPSFFHTVS